MKALKLPAIYFFSIICATVSYTQTQIDSYYEGHESFNNSDNVLIKENEVDSGLSTEMLDSVVVHFNDPNLKQAVRESFVIFIAVGTPPKEDGEADQDERVFLDPLLVQIEKGKSPGEEVAERWRGEWG